MKSEKTIESILNYNFIVPMRMQDEIDIFSGEKILIYTAIVTNDCTEVAAIYAIECEPEEPNTLHKKECSNFLVTSYPKIYLRKSLDAAMEIILALKTVNNFTAPDPNVDLKQIVY